MGMMMQTANQANDKRPTSFMKYGIIAEKIIMHVITEVTIVLIKAKMPSYLFLSICRQRYSGSLIMGLISPQVSIRQYFDAIACTKFNKSMLSELLIASKWDGDTQIYMHERINIKTSNKTWIENKTTNGNLSNLLIAGPEEFSS